jgi:hypothetical protein
MIQVSRLESGESPFSVGPGSVLYVVGVFLSLDLLYTELVSDARVDDTIFLYIFSFMGKKRMGRPPKKASERKTSAMLIPMTEDEREQIQAAAESEDAKPVTWAREVLLRAAKRRSSK